MRAPGTIRDLVVIGASAGGVEALRNLVGELPADLPAAVVVVLHLPPGGHSALAGILDAAGKLPAAVAEHGAKIEPGHLYVAPPDHHLLVDGDCLLLSGEPPENSHRPAIDALFRSAARTRGSSVAGVVLSGVLDDGTAGLVEVRARGGMTVVQDPEDATYRGMPDSALANVQVDHVLAAAAIGGQLRHLLAEPVTNAERDKAEALLGTADDDLQAALWMAVRALDEKASLARRLAGSASKRGSQELVRRYSESATEADRAARLLRSRLTSGQSEATSGPAAETGGPA
jgi:two-component system chemotaxis response regulator CheB